MQIFTDRGMYYQAVQIDTGGTEYQESVYRSVDLRGGAGNTTAVSVYEKVLAREGCLYQRLSAKGKSAGMHLLEESGNSFTGCRFERTGAGGAAGTGAGNSNRVIGEHLYISLATVKTHVLNIYSKLGVTNRIEALNYYHTYMQE